VTRIKRFEEFRFVGVRDTMVVYDTDDPEQAEALATRIQEENLIGRLLIQAFGPDTYEEARNRGFE
jgi:hypothetical protein